MINNIDIYDINFINKNCPEGKVPVFLLKSEEKNSIIHKEIRALFKRVGKSMGHHIPDLPVSEEIVVNKIDKDDLVSVYYATPEERDLIREQKNRIMNINNREMIALRTSCFAFNDKGDYNDAYRIPLAKIKTDKNIKEIIDQIKMPPSANITLFNILPLKANEYLLSFSSFTPSRRSIDITKLKNFHARFQLKLLDHFANNEIVLCDHNGNYYDTKDIRALLEKTRDKNDANLQSKLRRMDETSTSL